MLVRKFDVWWTNTCNVMDQTAIIKIATAMLQLEAKGDFQIISHNKSQNNQSNASAVINRAGLIIPIPSPRYESISPQTGLRRETINIKTERTITATPLQKVCNEDQKLLYTNISPGRSESDGVTNK